MELGRGYSFVARQKHFNVEGRHFYIDLVFYNYILKCFCAHRFKDWGLDSSRFRANADEDNKQIFAAKYLPYMPTKDELKRELNIEDFEKKDVD